MKMKRPSRVTITLPPSSLRASSSSWASCSLVLSDSPCCSLSRATSTRHSSRLRGGSSQSFTGATLDLDQAPARPEVVDRCRPDLALGSPRLVDVTADRQAGALGLDRLEDRGAAEMVARAALVAVVLGRRVDDEQGTLRAAVEALGGLLLVEVEAP